MAKPGAASGLPVPGIDFPPVELSQVHELLPWVQSYYAEDGILFDAALVRPALVRLLAEPALGRAHFIVDRSEMSARAGYVVFTFGFDHEFGGPIATLTDLFVRLDYRGHGLGTGTLRFVAETCQALGVCQLELQVERHNAAGQALYRSFSFREHDRLPMFLPLA